MHGRDLTKNQIRSERELGLRYLLVQMAGPDNTAVRLGRDKLQSTIRLVTPVAVLDVIRQVGPEFERSTGHQLDLSIMLNPEVPTYIKDGAIWSAAASNPWHLEEIDPGQRGPVRSLGRSPLAFAALGEDGVTATDKSGIAAALRGAKRIGMTGAGTSGGTFARLLDHLDLTDALRDSVKPLKGGEPMRQLLEGQVNLAVLPLTNIAPIPGVYPVAICPWEMEVHIDLAICLHIGANAAAQEFVDWITSPDHDEILAPLGLARD